MQFSDQSQGSQSIGKNLVLTGLDQKNDFCQQELNQRKEMQLSEQTQGSQSIGKNLVLAELNQRQSMEQHYQRSINIDHQDTPKLGEQTQMDIASNTKEELTPAEEKRMSDQQMPVVSGAEFKCDQCEQTFARRAYLNRHVESKVRQG